MSSAATALLFASSIGCISAGSSAASCQRSRPAARPPWVAMSSSAATASSYAVPITLVATGTVRNAKVWHVLNGSRPARPSCFRCPTIMSYSPLPALAAEIAFQNKRVVYAILFRAAADALREIAADPRHLGAEIGAVAVLHTWGQALHHHPHLHLIVPGGGLSPDQTRWIACRSGFLLPVRVLSRRFRTLFLERLRAAGAADKLRFSGAHATLAEPGAFADRLETLRTKEWVVYGSASECWPKVLADFGPPAAPQPRVSPVLPGSSEWIGTPRVELFEQLRLEHEFGVGTIAGVAAKFGVHRRMVRQAIAGALPPARRYPARVKPKLDEVVGFIDQVLDEDRRAPRKQRHTARRIYRRLLTEFPAADVAESTVRNYVRARKRALGLVKRETFVPQSYVFGHEAQVDWYEAWADLGGERTRMQVFAMRSMASGAAFHRAYLHETQQAFLEAHEHAFAYSGGVFRLLRYDNLASAVRKILRGHRARRRCGSWRFARIGALRPSSARPVRVMRKAALRARVAISVAIIWSRCLM